MWQIIGWIVWGIAALLAVSFAWGCRSYSKSGQGFQWATGVQTFFLWVVVILFLIFEWNKLHILWIAPISFFSARLLVLSRVPLLSPIILFATRTFLGIILIGLEKPEEFGAPLDAVILNKMELIRNLAKKRIHNDPNLSMPENVNSLSEYMLMGLPEATIVTIVETYWQLNNQGLSEKEILETIENHRASFGDVGTLPSQLTLFNYIKYRLRLEHSHGAPISDNFIEEAIKEATEAFAG
jgi:hypothetical protein